jgi:hypothetical protein
LADLSDVENALVAAILAAAVAGPAACPLLGGSAVRVYRGSPPVAGLASDRAAGIVDVTVLPVPDATRDTTRWGVQTNLIAVANGIGASASGQTASFTGVAVGGELAGLLVNGMPFIYTAQEGDSADLVAAALADLVRVNQTCWLDQSSITIPGSFTLVARTAGVASLLQEWSRQEQSFRLSVRAPSPAARDAVCAAIGAALAQIAFLSLADGSAGRLRYQKTASFDDDQVASVYRRELVYGVEYPTTVMIQAPTMLFGDSDYNTVPTYT